MTCNFFYSYLYLAGFLKTFSPNGPFVSNSFFFGQKLSLFNRKVAIIKTKSANIAFFSLLPISFSSLFLFILSFSFVTVIWSSSSLRNLPFDAFSLKWLQISLGWFSKKLVIYKLIFWSSYLLLMYLYFFLSVSLFFAR